MCQQLAHFSLSCPLQISHTVHSAETARGPCLQRQQDEHHHPRLQSSSFSIRYHAAWVQVDEVKNIMVENIEKVLERGEKIELLVDKTDNLRFQVMPPGPHRIMRLLTGACNWAGSATLKRLAAEITPCAHSRPTRCPIRSR